jgi:hypothetical protein
MSTFLVDITGKSGKCYGFHFECENWDQANAMVADITDHDKVFAVVLGSLIASIPIEEVPNESG